MSSRRSRISVRPNVARRSTSANLAEKETKSESTSQINILQIESNLSVLTPKGSDNTTEPNKIPELGLNLKPQRSETAGTLTHDQLLLAKNSIQAVSNVDVIEKDVSKDAGEIVSKEPLGVLDKSEDKLESSNDETDSIVKPTEVKGEEIKEVTVGKPAGVRARRFSRPRPNLIEGGRHRVRHPSVSASDSEDELRKLPPPITRLTSSSVGSSTSGVVEQIVATTRQQASDFHRDSALKTTDALKEKQNDPLATEKEDNYTHITEKAPETKHRKRCKMSDEPLDRSKMTMKDLIYWNPVNNPIKKPDSETVAKSIKKDKEAPKNDKEQEIQIEIHKDRDEENTDTPLPVPQVRLGPDGNIILNEQSLMVDTSPVKPAALFDSDVIHEDGNWVTSASFRKRTKATYWSNKETTKFYRAISIVGTDFSMMNKLFPKRSRAELKNKFKREEKVNRYLIEKALNEPGTFDLSIFKSSDEEEPKQKVKRRKPLNREKRKKSKTVYEDSDSEEEPHPNTGIRVVTDKDVVSSYSKYIGDTSDDDICEDNDQEEKMPSFDKPTRYGRVPKRISVDSPDDTEKETSTKAKVSRIEPPNNPGIGKGGKKRGRPKRKTGSLTGPVLANLPESAPGQFLSLSKIDSASKDITPGQLIFVTGKSSDAKSTNQKSAMSLIHVYVVSPSGTHNMSRGQSSTVSGQSGNISLTISPRLAGVSLLKKPQQPTVKQGKSLITNEQIVTIPALSSIQGARGQTELTKVTLPMPKVIKVFRGHPRVERQKASAPGRAETVNKTAEVEGTMEGVDKQLEVRQTSEGQTPSA